MELLREPWPWYITGPLIGLIVPALLLLGNKHFGISSNFRHICAACFPANIKFFKYDWKKERWNFFFIGGIVAGAALTSLFLMNDNPMVVDERLVSNLAGFGINDYSGLVPSELFSFESIVTLRGMIILVVGGFLVGFGTRYAGGCTSGHSIMGLSTLQMPSLIATCCFMAGGIITSNFILPLILAL